MKRSGFVIRPQDILLLLKLVAQRGYDWRQQDLANALGLSQAEVANGLERLRIVGLAHHEKRDIYPLAAVEFLIHGLKYMLPPVVGAHSRGIPTASSAPPMKGKVIGDELPMVWACDDGNQRGLALEPIYPSVPFAAKRDDRLYELLVVVDSLRVGGARQSKFAAEIVKRLLTEAAK